MHMTVTTLACGLMALAAATPLPAAVVAQPTEPSGVYDHPAYDPDFPTPDNAAALYRHLPEFDAYMNSPRVGGVLVFDYDDEVPWLRLHPEAPSVPNAEFAAAARRYAAANRPAIELFDRASRVDVCDFGALAEGGDAEARESEVMRITRLLRFAHRLLMLDAHIAWEAGQYERAMGRWATGVRCARQCGSQPDSPLASIVGLGFLEATVERANRALGQWAAMPVRAIEARELIDAVAALDREDPTGAIASWYANQRASGQNLLAQLDDGVSPWDLATPPHVLIQTPGPHNTSDFGGIILSHEPPLPFRRMEPEAVRRAIVDSLATLDRVRDWMLEGGRQQEIDAAFDRARNDPAFIAPIILWAAPARNTMNERTRRSVDELRTRLDAVAAQDD